MRTVIRTMLAAAAGAALIASGTTVVRLSEPAFADASPVAGEPTARPGLIPEALAADAPTGPDALVVPDPQLTAPTVVEPEPEQQPEPEPERAEPIRRAEPAPQSPSRTAPATDEPAPAVAEPTIAQVATEPAVRQVPVEQPDDDEQQDQDASADEEPARERPALLGRLTEPLGVTCGGPLRRLCG